MTAEEFSVLLNRFAVRPIPSTTIRHVYLWHGDTVALRAILPPNLAQELALYTLTTTLPRTPFAADEARRVLSTAIRLWLRERMSHSSAQQVVVVTGASLLARYSVPVNDFFQIAGETCMVIVVVSPVETDFQSPRPLPSYVEVRPHATLEYLQSTLGASAYIGAS